jgi:acyl-CoA thioesterase-1
MSSNISEPAPRSRIGISGRLAPGCRESGGIAERWKWQVRMKSSADQTARLMRRALALLGIVFWLGAAGCGRKEPEQPTAPAVAESGHESSTGRSGLPDDRPVIVAFGDSLTAGRGVDPEQNYPSQLQRKLDAEGYRYRVVNAGVSGDTSAQGLDRLAAIRDLRPSIVIVELGANDGLRGLPVEATRQNLDAIVTQLKADGTVVVLAGMALPPNYGSSYTGAFRSMFPDLARRHRAALVPFLLQEVAGHPELNQDDGIHPTAKGYSIVVENIWAILRPVLSNRG